MAFKDMVQIGLDTLVRQVPMMFTWSGNNFATEITGYAAAVTDATALEPGGFKDVIDQLLYAKPEDFPAAVEVGQTVKLQNSASRHYRIEFLKEAPGSAFIRMALVSVHK